MERFNKGLANVPVCLTVLKLHKGKRIPNFLLKGIKWGENYARHKKASNFSWGQHARKEIDKEIIAVLSPISQSHCFYCDLKEVIAGISIPELDHFCPKTIKPIKAYYFPNLNLSCRACNSYKGSKYNKVLLDFGKLNYSFDNYYYIDYTTGYIRVRPDISYKNQVQARYTLLLLGINYDYRPVSRRKELIAYQKTNMPDIDDFSYRYYISRNV